MKYCIDSSKVLSPMEYYKDKSEKGKYTHAHSRGTLSPHYSQIQHTSNNFPTSN